ncbi:MAG: hypothetical protein ACSLEW_12070 [Nocardioides sp.]
MWPRTGAALACSAMDELSPESADVPLNLAVDDVAWTADLIDTYRAGDIDTTVQALEEMLARLRKAAKAKRMLVSVEPMILREALGLADARGKR